MENISLESTRKSLKGLHYPVKIGAPASAAIFRDRKIGNTRKRLPYLCGLSPPIMASPWQEKEKT
ncbi:MAG: hypothetical protein LBB65_02280 [Burkholderiales bacterium]|jgi:hypothetical protein|nr:hypothetical protein [Burkholderiales bacterium]